MLSFLRDFAIKIVAAFFRPCKVFSVKKIFSFFESFQRDPRIIQIKLQTFREFARMVWGLHGTWDIICK